MVVLNHASGSLNRVRSSRRLRRVPELRRLVGYRIGFIISKTLSDKAEALHAIERLQAPVLEENKKGSVMLKIGLRFIGAAIIWQLFRIPLILALGLLIGLALATHSHACTGGCDQTTGVCFSANS